jgi:hypothetical protein
VDIGGAALGADDDILLDDRAVGRGISPRWALHPEAAWVYFAGGHKAKLILSKARKGITHNWLLPASVTPYSAATCKNYSIVKIHKIEEKG